MSEQFAFDAYHKWLGIPPAEQPPHYYRLLGINLYETDPEVISGAADRQATYVRTYQSSTHSARAQQLLNEISLARICLLNPTRKAEYDARIRMELVQKQAPPPPPAYSPPQSSTAPLPAARPLPVAGMMPLQPVQPLAQPQPMPPPASPPVQPAAAPQNSPGVGENDRAARRPSWQLPVLGGVLLVVVVGALLLVSALMRSTPRRALTGAALNQGNGTDDPHGEVPLPTPNDQETGPPPSRTKSPATKTTRITGSTGGTPSTGKGKAIRPLTPGQTGPIDLLSQIDPQKHARRGSWKFVDGVLMSPQVETARLRLPYQPPLEYKLTLEVTRTLGDENLNVILVSGDVQFALLLDARAGHLSGLHLLDDRTAMSNDSTFDGQVFTNRKWATVEITVRRWGVNVTVDGKTIIGWLGDIKRLSMDDVSGIDADSLYLGSADSSYLFRKVVIEALEPAEPPKVVSKPLPKVDFFPDVPAQQPPRSLADLVNAPADQTTARRPPPKNRKPMPEQAAIDAAIKLIRDVYKENFEAAREREQKTALANKLIADAEETDDDAAAQCALYLTAARLAGDTGDFQLAWQAADTLANEYVMSPLALKQETLVQAANRAKRPDELKFLSETYALLAGDAVYENEFGIAAKLAQESVVAARRSKDAALLTRAERGLAELRALQAEFEKVKAARETLKTSPDDPAANLTWGKFVCLYKRDWITGLPLLAKSGDEQLALLAKGDLATPTATAAQLELGNSWWALGDALEGDVPQDSARLRGARWYRQCASELTGLSQIRVQQRLVTASHIELGVARGEWTGLLPLVDTVRHASAGTWERRGTQLAIANKSSEKARLLIPIQLKGDYTLQFDFVRTAGNGPIVFVVPVEDKQCLVVIGESDRYRLQINTSVRKEIRATTLSNNRLQSVEISVNKTAVAAAIRVKVNGQPLVAWQGDADTLTLDSDWALARPNAPGLGTTGIAKVLFLDARLKLEDGATVLYTP